MLHSVLLVGRWDPFTPWGLGCSHMPLDVQVASVAPFCEGPITHPPGTFLTSVSCVDTEGGRDLVIAEGFGQLVHLGRPSSLAHRAWALLPEAS